MLQESIDAVKQFHIEKNIDYRQSLLDKALSPCSRHSLIVHQMKDASVAALKQFKAFLASPEKILDLRLLRQSLILEEVAELIEAIDQCNELETLDGMADSTYVINGAAVAFDLPLSSAFEEVHRSNMTKAPRSRNPDDARLHDKGEDYRPPDIGRVLIEYRKAQTLEKTPAIPETIFCDRCMQKPANARGGWISEDNGQFVSCQGCIEARTGALAAELLKTASYVPDEAKDLENKRLAKLETQILAGCEGCGRKVLVPADGRLVPDMGAVLVSHVQGAERHVVCGYCSGSPKVLERILNVASAYGVYCETIPSQPDPNNRSTSV